MRVQELMTSDVQSCEPDEDLGRVAQIMWDYDCGIVPIVEGDGRVAGVLTDRDVCMAAWSRGRPLAALRVADTMIREVFTCSPEDDIQAAMSLMRRASVRRLPVLDARGILVGILSLNDIATEAERQPERGSRQLPASEVAATLAAVCKPRTPRARETEIAPAGGGRTERQRSTSVALGSPGRSGAAPQPTA